MYVDTYLIAEFMWNRIGMKMTFQSYASVIDWELIFEYRKRIDLNFVVSS